MRRPTFVELALIAVLIVLVGQEAVHTQERLTPEQFATTPTSDSSFTPIEFIGSTAFIKLRNDVNEKETVLGSLMHARIVKTNKNWTVVSGYGFFPHSSKPLNGIFCLKTDEIRYIFMSETMLSVAQRESDAVKNYREQNPEASDKNHLQILHDALIAEGFNNTSELRDDTLKQEAAATQRKKELLGKFKELSRERDEQLKENKPE